MQIVISHLLKNSDKVEVNVLFCGDMRRSSSSNENLNAAGMVIPNWNVITNTNQQTYGASASKSGVNSLLGSVEIAFDDMIYLSLTD